MISDLSHFRFPSLISRPENKIAIFKSNVMTTAKRVIPHA